MRAADQALATMDMFLGSRGDPLNVVHAKQFDLETDKNGGFLKYGYPNSWMVYFIEHPTKMDDDWG